VIDSLLVLPEHLCERLTGALESGIISTSAPTAALESVLGTSGYNSEVQSALASLHSLGLSDTAAATVIRAVSKAGARSSRADIVWSGPEVPGLYARDTKRVLEELVDSAVRSLCICTYVYFDGPKAFASLAHRMEDLPTLNVMLLLNIQRKRGDTTNADHLVRRFADRFWSGDWPGASRPRVFYDPRALDEKAPSGVLHAKAVVSDDAVFVTSANMTEAALERNIELGLLIRDAALAATTLAHFQTLIDRQLLKPLPAE
jgi:phosphatidylserine/phosphatidylglycerophosphate/cardiolipin synthase-like enzyme